MLRHILSTPYVRHYRLLLRARCPHVCRDHPGRLAEPGHTLCAECLEYRRWMYEHKYVRRVA